MLDHCIEQESLALPILSCLQVAGLWYIQGIALGIALLLTAVKRIQYHFWLKAARARRATNQQHEEAASDSPGQPICSPDSPPGGASVAELPLQMLSLNGRRQQKVHAQLHAQSALNKPSPLGMFSSSGGAAVSGDGQHGDCVAEITLPPGGVASYAGGPASPAVDGRMLAALPGVVESHLQQAPRSAAALNTS